MPTNPIPVYSEPVPKVNGRNIELSIYLKDVRNIARDFAQLYSAYTFTGRLLPNSGEVSGGGLKYNPNDPDINANIEPVEEVAPSAELPEYGGRTGVPKFAEVHTWGHKLVFDRKALIRNDVRLYNQRMRGAVMSLDRRFRIQALKEVTDRLQEDGRFIVAENDWADFTVEGSAPTLTKDRPEADIDAALSVFDEDDQGQTPNLFIANPTMWLKFTHGYGRKYAKDLLQSYDLEPVINRGWPDGKVLLAAEGQLGGTYWEEANGPMVDTTEGPRRSRIVEMEGSPAYAVDNTPAAIEIRVNP